MIKLFPTIVYSIMLGTIVFALMGTLTKEKSRQTGYLAGLLMLLLVHVLGELLMHTGAYVYAPNLVGWQVPLRVLLGPMLYFYACAAMSLQKQLTIKHIVLALSGPALVIISMLPFVLGFTAEEKLALADPATRNPEHFKIAKFVCVAGMTIFVIYTSIYLSAALKVHKRHYQQLLERFSTIEQRSLIWFKRILWIWGGAWLFYAVEYVLDFIGFRWSGTGIVFPLIEASILMVFAHLALKQPILKDAEKVETNSPKTVPRTATLKPEQMQDIAQKLRQVMTHEALFKEEDLSLNRLSDAVSCSENHISETLSQHLNSNFFAFVNGYRVEAAQELLRSTDKLISTIAYDVGFNSKSTFNSAFKKATSMTPSAWRKQHKSQNVLKEAS